MSGSCEHAKYARLTSGPRSRGMCVHGAHGKCDRMRRRFRQRPSATIEGCGKSAGALFVVSTALMEYRTKPQLISVVSMRMRHLAAVQNQPHWSLLLFLLPRSRRLKFLTMKLMQWLCMTMKSMRSSANSSRMLSVRVCWRMAQTPVDTFVANNSAYQ